VVDLQAAPLVMAGGLPEVLTGSDVNSLETEGIFTALLRLQNALETNDTLETERAIQLLDESVTNLNFSRAELGARQQGLDTLGARLDSEDTDLQGSLSLTFDADMVEVVSKLSGQTSAYQASLQAMGQILSMSLLDYI
jgi:flagellar hook-associated protein 3 FlgL